MVEAHREDSHGQRAKAPDLLRDPQNSAAIDGGVQSESITNGADANLTEKRYCNRVEGVGRCNPDPRRDPFAVKDPLGGSQLRSLAISRQTREFAERVELDDSRINRYVVVLVTVHADRPAASLPAPHLVPKIRPFAVYNEMSVLVVGHDSEDGDDAGLCQDFGDLAPDGPIHGRTEVIEADEIPGVLQGFTPNKS